MFSYSSNEEDFHGECDSREAAIEEAKCEYPDQKHFWTGRNVPVDPLRYVHADLLIEHIINQDDFCIEQAEGWPGCNKEQEDELTAALQAAFREWMTRHKLEPTFWIIDKVQEHVIEEVNSND